jgi:hypothetical protein
MKHSLKLGLAAAALVALSTPVFAQAGGAVPPAMPGPGANTSSDKGGHDVTGPNSAAPGVERGRSGSGTADDSANPSAPGRATPGAGR